MTVACAYPQINEFRQFYASIKRYGNLNKYVL